MRERGKGEDKRERGGGGKRGEEEKRARRYGMGCFRNQLN